jgi:ABC-type nitrate/sulfonate/bicarbonate transport system substrate-binding protein
MRTSTRWIMSFLTAGLVVLGGLAFWYWDSPVQSRRLFAGPVEKISISTSADAKSALLFIAEHEGYFGNNGLEVTLKILQSGKMGCELLKAGNIDIANAADFVLVSEVFAGTKSLRCLGAIAAADDHQVIARKESGILTPGDLRGRRIGVPHGTSAEFFLGRFLAFNNLGLREVEVVDVNASDMEDALAHDNVDAVMVWEKWADALKKRMANQVVSWPGQGGQKYYWLLMTTDALVKARPGVLERLFNALDQAEIFLKSHKDASIEIIARRISCAPAIIKDSLIRSTYGLSLDQTLFIMMEDEARWMIKNSLTGQARVPNYLDYINAEALARINPQAVSVIIPKDRSK